MGGVRDSFSSSSFLFRLSIEPPPPVFKALVMMISPKQPSERDFKEVFSVSITKPMGIVFSENLPFSSLVVSSLPLTGEAARSTRLAVGDVLLSVDGKSTLLLTFDSSMKALANANGEYVHLRFGRGGVRPPPQQPKAASFSPLLQGATPNRTAAAAARDFAAAAVPSHAAKQASAARHHHGTPLLVSRSQQQLPLPRSSSSSLSDTTGSVSEIETEDSNATSTVSAMPAARPRPSRYDVTMTGARSNIASSLISVRDLLCRGTTKTTSTSTLSPPQFTATNTNTSTKNDDDRGGPSSDSYRNGGGALQRRGGTSRYAQQGGVQGDDDHAGVGVGCARGVGEWLLTRCEEEEEEENDDDDRSFKEESTDQVDLSSDIVIREVDEKKLRFLDDVAAQGDNYDEMRSKVSAASENPNQPAITPLARARMKAREAEALAQSRERATNEYKAGKVPNPLNALAELGLLSVVVESMNQQHPTTGGLPPPAPEATTTKNADEGTTKEATSSVVPTLLLPPMMSASETVNAIQHRIASLIRRHEPERLPLLKKLLRKYQGNEKECLQKLETRYAETFSALMSCASSNNAEGGSDSSSDRPLAVERINCDDDDDDDGGGEGDGRLLLPAPPRSSTNSTRINGAEVPCNDDNHHGDSQELQQGTHVAQRRSCETTRDVVERAKLKGATEIGIDDCGEKTSSRGVKPFCSSSLLLAPILEANEDAAKTPRSGGTGAPKGGDWRHTTTVAGGPTAGALVGTTPPPQVVDAPPHPPPSSPSPVLLSPSVVQSPQPTADDRGRSASHPSGEAREPAGSRSGNFTALVSELVNYIYGTASESDHAERLAAIFLAYKGREQVLLKLLETKAEVKADDDKQRVLVGGGGVVVPKMIEYLSEAESDEDPAETPVGRPALPRKGIMLSSQGDDDTISTISHSIMSQRIEEVDEKEESKKKKRGGTEQEEHVVLSAGAGAGAKESVGAVGAVGGNKKTIEEDVHIPEVPRSFVDKENIASTQNSINVGANTTAAAKAPSLKKQFGNATTKFFGKFGKKESGGSKQGITERGRS